MLDIGWPELLVVGAVALVAVGPDDLPKVMHTLGVWVGKGRRFLQAVQHDLERLSFEAEQAEREKAAREAQEAEAAASSDPVKSGEDTP